MDQIRDALHHTIQLLSDPLVRALTTLLAVASFGISIWAFRRTSAVLQSHLDNLRSEQARFVEAQWSNIDRLAISNSDCARLMADMFGIEGETEAKREALHYMFLNNLATSFIAWKNNVLDFDAYDGHMTYFFSSYKGDHAYLMRLIEVAHFHSEFVRECRRRLEVRGSNPAAHSHTRQH